MQRVVDLVRQVTRRRRNSPERTPKLIQGTSIAAAAQRIIEKTGHFKDELDALVELSRELPLLDSSELDEAQLAPTQHFIRELRDVGMEIEAYSQAALSYERGKSKSWKRDRQEAERLARRVNERLLDLFAQLQAQGPIYVPQNAAEVAKAELLMHNGMGLPLPVCWQILDMAEYWPQIRFTDPLKLDRWSPSHRETMQLHVNVPEMLGFPAVQKVVLAIGGHNMLTREGFTDGAWDAFEVETGGDLPGRSVTHHCLPVPYWEQDIPAVHLISWRRDDDEETRRVLTSLRPKARLRITATAPQHAEWLEHLVPLRVELYFARA